MDPQGLSYRRGEGQEVAPSGKARDPRGTATSRKEHSVYGRVRQHRVHDSRSAGLRSGGAAFGLTSALLVAGVRDARVHGHLPVVVERVPKAIVCFIGMLSFRWRRPESAPGPPRMFQRRKSTGRDRAENRSGNTAGTSWA